MAALVAGQATGSFAFISEADDFGAIGAVTDKFLGDPEGQAIFARGSSSTGPLGSVAQTAYTVDVPL